MFCFFSSPLFRSRSPWPLIGARIRPLRRSRQRSSASLPCRLPLKPHRWLSRVSYFRGSGFPLAYSEPSSTHRGQAFPAALTANLEQPTQSIAFQRLDCTPASEPDNALPVIPSPVEPSSYASRPLLPGHNNVGCTGFGDGISPLAGKCNAHPSADNSECTSVTFEDVSSPPTSD